MELIVKKISLKNQTSDFHYWQTQSYQKRLDTLEQIRKEYHQWKDNNVESRFQRVYTISQR
ncbi:toxin secretion, membrane fusion protein [Cyanobacterium aponinum UTEX 3222]|uniref:toxin secretion, membrane fusion protein n=1 Tax=Cyanobacterium aponinum TaxID=379064 RepID=UPI002B4C1B14|nr:toxin secretion, membrane fusion protein [Cyanobacterium aponinum]WRL39550.1 toxin secretion, membrane fusion protein [Cyanobacterium aponinum UTEX 3221]WRL42323.1 toxin secretion, membrane fusion protein [Cyanobacterium aponinum UTEX 3222]